MGVPSEAEASSAGPARERGSARQRVLDVAAELFGSRGYERTPLRVVADSLGLSKAAIYYHFKAKEDLLLAMVSPVLDRIDELIDSAGPRLRSSSERRRFLAGYVDELTGHAGIVALLLRDPGVAEHAVGRRFVSQHVRMRQLLGAGDEPASVIRTNTALLALELAVVEFGDADPDDVRETALDIAVSVLESGRS
jgi:AcrR family transcriptional regulator